MKQMTFQYKPLSQKSAAPNECGLTKAHFIGKMELEGAIAIVKKAVINPFEERFKESSLELDCGTFTLKTKPSKTSASTRWKDIYTDLYSFLEIRADDSRAASQKDVEYLEGSGYCISVQALQDQIAKFQENRTSEASESIAIDWPSKKKTEEYPTQLTIPARDYRQITPETAITTLQAKRFTAGVIPNYTTPFKDELKRWFTANTGFDAKDRIPDEETGFVERTLELAPGSYIQVQLIPEDTPQYEEVLEDVSIHLTDLAGNVPVTAFKHTTHKGKPYVCIKSIYSSLQTEALQTQNLVKRTARWDIVP